MLLPSLCALDADRLVAQDLQHPRHARARPTTMRAIAPSPARRWRSTCPSTASRRSPAFSNACPISRSMRRRPRASARWPRRSARSTMAWRSSCRPRPACSSRPSPGFRPAASPASGCASAWKSRSAPISKPAATSTTPSPAPFPRSAFSASITTSARRRCRTCWRCASPTCMFEPLWNAAHIDHVQITVAETVGLEGRGRLLRRRRRAARHGAEPHAATAGAGRDGAAGQLRSHGGARREGQGAARAAPDRPGRDRHRPVPAPGAIAGAAVPGYAEELGKQLRHRDVRRDQGAYRQLALEGRAVLPAHRQAPARAQDRNRRPVPPRAPLDLRRQGRAHRAQPAGHRHPARREHRAVADGQGARARPRGHPPARGAARHRDARRLRRADQAHRLRTPAARPDRRRPDPVRPPRRGRGAVGLDRRDPRELGRPRRQRPSPIRPAAGGRRRRSR